MANMDAGPFAMKNETPLSGCTVIRAARTRDRVGDYTSCAAAKNDRLRNCCLSQRQTIHFRAFDRCQSGKFLGKYGGLSEKNPKSSKLGKKDGYELRMKTLFDTNNHNCSYEDRRDCRGCQRHNGHEICAPVTPHRNHGSLALDYPR